jgi:hypothetical protein
VEQIWSRFGSQNAIYGLPISNFCLNTHHAASLEVCRQILKAFCQCLDRLNNLESSGNLVNKIQNAVHWSTQLLNEPKIYRWIQNLMGSFSWADSLHLEKQWNKVELNYPELQHFEVNSSMQLRPLDLIKYNHSKVQLLSQLVEHDQVHFDIHYLWSHTL